MKKRTKCSRYLSIDYKLKTEDIEMSVANMYDFQQNLIFPNISWGLGLHECDLLVIRPSNYAIEIEIKTSIADLKADFKKSHNHIDRKNRIKELYYAIPNYLYDKAIELIPETAGIITCSVNSKKGIIESKIVRRAKINTTARKLTDDEKNKALRLGSIRYWFFKDKILKLKNS